MGWLARDGAATVLNVDIGELKSEALRRIAHARSSVVGSALNAQLVSRTERALDRLASRLQRTLRVGIAGEFNTGKSSLCNRLIGLEGLPTAAIANTNSATRIYYSDDIELLVVGRDGSRRPWSGEDGIGDKGLLRIDVGFPAPRLRKVEFLDLPGLADPRFPRSLDDILIHHVDAVLWCTASMQAWKESERSAWWDMPERLRDNSILALTHRDLIQQAADETALIERLKLELSSDFAAIVPVSTRARATNGSAQPKDYDATGIAELWTAITDLVSSLELARIHRAAKISGAVLQRMLD
ncbi:MAG: GTPase [Pseudomonadota bacterium]